MQRGILLLVLIASSCATVRSADAACDAYVADEMARVFLQYELFRDRGFQEGLVGTARSSLERARKALWGEPTLTTEPVCLKRHRRTTAWKELKADLDSAEEIVFELEEARGVRFIEYASGRPLWVDSTTGKPIPDDFADAI